MSTENTAPTPTPAEAPAIQADALEAISQETPEAELAAKAEAAAPKKEEKKASAKKKLSLKVDGQSEDFEIDLDNEEELRKHFQLSRVAQKRMQESAEYRKNVQNFFDLLKNDPVRVLSDPSIGIDIKKMAESVMNNELEEMKKSPEQREKEQLMKELEDYKKQVEAEKKSREESEYTRLQEKAAVELDNDISSALETSKLPKSPYTVKKVAEYMMLALQNNIDVSARDVIPLVQKNMTSEIREMFSMLPDDAIEDFLGKDNLTKLRKRSLARIKQSPEVLSNIKSTGSDVKKAEQKQEVKKISFNDFLKTNWSKG